MRGVGRSKVEKRRKKRKEREKETIIRTTCETSGPNIVLGGSPGGLDMIASQPTVLTRIRERCARTSELPLLVRSGVFFLFICLGRKVF